MKKGKSRNRQHRKLKCKRKFYNPSISFAIKPPKCKHMEIKPRVYKRINL